MTTRRDLEDLTRASEMLYARERQAVASILQEEARLRAQLARLDRMIVAAREEAGRDTAFRALGADLQWQQWTARARAGLNADLARVMARKMRVMDRLRRAFGRRDAVARLEQGRQQEVRDAAQRRAWDRIAELMVMK
ncbi:hypothetical protein [Chachezhania sediminis]|uniref:hypothetical protein n=1 Tax=Chachezhania sediminis TaxID=2599291 RepID=UPI00131A8F56|nr:hypothetical protein [Chachezhania sediminis]